MKKKLRISSPAKLAHTNLLRDPRERNGKVCLYRSPPGTVQANSAAPFTTVSHEGVLISLFWSPLQYPDQDLSYASE